MWVKVELTLQSLTLGILVLFYLLAFFFPPSLSSAMVELAPTRICKPFEQVWLNPAEFKSHQEGGNQRRENAEAVQVHELYARRPHTKKQPFDLLLRFSPPSSLLPHHK